MEIKREFREDGIHHIERLNVEEVGYLDFIKNNDDKEINKRLSIEILLELITEEYIDFDYILYKKGAENWKLTEKGEKYLDKFLENKLIYPNGVPQNGDEQLKYCEKCKFYNGGYISPYHCKKFVDLYEDIVPCEYFERSNNEWIR